ncbi:CDP-diacylglycerol--serine O-phosphatidyltransferase [Natranaerobius trueperi]|uniref:CDP-diacylglycerol--serine O-phosphatidyltransferase n=1 Tax=Natranaerobius trueperi TaxID=759412 RepID=A0A226BVA4_9FIRM|nr:CDP-diacylglycerol--serine O-phosphatidyltransferase [Natranaerobius trueperi]OWZ82923.1 CDP-diacylglycerol--serine O-phosphatidyltransferase [Natranaerobius trueperi]
MGISKWMPSILTFTNLSLGFLALVLLYTGNERMALSLVILALCFDGVDGRLARKLNVTAVFGKELDSLSDNFSFGIVPAYFYVVHQSEITSLHLVLALVFLICGTFQVAKYNTDFLYGSSENVLLGLPINVAGIMVAIMSYMTIFPIYVEALIIVILSILMVPEIPYPSLKGYQPTKKIHFLLPILTAIIFIVFPIVTFAMLSLYVLIGLINAFFNVDVLQKSNQ